MWSRESADATSRIRKSPTRRDALSEHVPKETNLDQMCHELEQRALNRLAVTALLDKAARSYGVEPTNDEIERAIPRDVDVESIARRETAKGRALLAIYQGAGAATVRRDILDPQHISDTEFAAFRNNFHSESQVQQFLQQDNVKLLRKASGSRSAASCCCANFANTSRRKRRRLNNHIRLLPRESGSSCSPGLTAW
jgi:hypothetical protein